MNYAQALAYIRMETRIFLREPMALFFTVVFPLLLLFIFGGIWGNTPSPQHGYPGYISTSLPGFVTMIIATSGILTLSAIAASYREIGFLRLLRTTPLMPLTILFGQVTTLFLVTILGVALLLGAAAVVWDAPFAKHPFVFVFAFCEICVAVYSLGYLLAAVAPSVRSVQIVGMVVFFPMLFLCGVALPSFILPAGIRAVSQFLPLTPAVDLLQWVWFGGDPRDAAGNAIALAVFSGINLLLISRAFRWEEGEIKRKTGPIIAVGTAVGCWILTVALLSVT